MGRQAHFDFVAVDYRGHGRSPGRRGVVREFEELVRDLQSTVTWVRKQRDGLPIFLLGHCAGGQVAIRVAHENRGEIAGVIASNPMIRIGMPVPPGKARLGKLLAKLAPWVTLNADLPVEGMTRDPLMLERYRTDKLRHKRISPPLYFGLVEGGETLLDSARQIQTPMLLLVGGQDPVLSTASTHEFFGRVGSGDKTLSLYPEMLHEPLNELGRERIFDDLARWLELRGLAP
jgi:alpha-beta hydrolase superfamily lysophospholipase